ncbi:MAG: hypothetical protein DYG89_13150 [Caldilinea sp. CFX5]|nr:hypothetical protein [Caldilinea sp. CFX5]
MTPYTVPIKPTNTPVMDLIQQTQTTPHPLILAVEGMSAPMAVMMNLDAYEKNQRRDYLFYQLQITQLEQWLERVDGQWQDAAIRQACVTTWQSSITALWDVAPEPVQELCAALSLAVKALTPAQLSHEQVSALHYCLELLRDSDPTAAAQETAHERLIKSGLPPLLSFEDDSLARSYLAAS